MRRPLWVSAVLTMAMWSAFAQSTHANPSSDGLELLKQVAQHYADAKSYYIEAVEELTWNKTVLTAAQAPGNRYYYEGRSNTGSAIVVGNGKTMWEYRVDEHRYTVKSQPKETSIQSTARPLSQMSLFQAENLRNKLGDLLRYLKSAERLPDTTLTVYGHTVPCNVVRGIRSEKSMGMEYWFAETIWIDSTRHIVLRTSEINTSAARGAAPIPASEEITTNFTTTELDGPVRENLFTFMPPADAKLVDNFPDSAKDLAGGNMMGEANP